MGVLDRYVGFISVDQTPHFAQDFVNKTFDHILDIRLKNGNLFSGILENYEINEQGQINYLSLVKCLKWKDKKQSDNAEKKEVVGLVPGDVFTIPFDSIQDINVTKKPNAQIFIIENNEGVTGIKEKIDKIREQNVYREWVLNTYLFFMIDTTPEMEPWLRKYAHDKFEFIDEPEFHYLDSRKRAEHLLDGYFTTEEKELFVVKDV